MVQTYKIMVWEIIRFNYKAKTLVTFFSKIKATYISQNKFTGKLRTSLVNGMEFMPFDESENGGCFVQARDQSKYKCFVAGMVQNSIIHY